MNKRQLHIYLFVFVASILCSNHLAFAYNNHSPKPLLQSASELDYPPFSIVKPDGTADGFSVDLLKAVVDAADYEITISVGPWNEIKQQLAEGRLDVLPLVGYSLDRDKVYDFTVPYLQMRGTIFVRKGEKIIQSEADLKDKEVLVMRGDNAQEYAVKKNLTKHLILTTSFKEAMELLSSGKHDAVFCQYLMGLQLIKELGIKNIVSVASKHSKSLKPRSTKVSGFEQKFCFAVPEGEKELLDNLNEGLAIVFANGTYEELYNQWFGPILPKPRVPLATVIKSVVMTLLPILLFIALSGVWYLRREVRRKTIHLSTEIEERKKAETKYKQMFLDNKAIKLLIDPTNGNIVEANDAACEFYQYSKDELLGLGIKDINMLPPDKIQEEMESATLQNRPFFSFRHQKSTGEIRDVEVYSGPITVDGNILLFSIIHDVSERKKLAKQLRQSHKMQAVGTLAGGIAHEFNNLLAVIMGCAEMARDEVAKDSFAKGQLDNILKASHRVKGLVKQILTFSRQAQQQRIAVNLGPLVKESVKLIQSSLPSSVEIQQNIGSDCHNTKVDPTEIQQIVMNLCANSVWAMKENGTINISLHEVLLSNHDESIVNGLPAGCYVKLSFSDTGCGIDKKTLSQIFDPFFTTKEVGQGTGMGLAIIHGIVESSGGAITAESTIGEGASFHLYFPVTEEPVAEVQVKKREIQRGTERILFVDDDTMYAEMCSAMISRLGYEVDVKLNSQEALEAFTIAPHTYDLVITDQIMPNLSGEDLVKEIRTIIPEIPIILCTGYSTQMNDTKAKSLGINAFAYKPIVQKDIAALIRKVLDVT